MIIYRDHRTEGRGPVIKGQLAQFLCDELKLELNHNKTLITHARTRAARYLGYEIITQHNDSKTSAGGRSAKCAPYRRHGELWHRTAM